MRDSVSCARSFRFFVQAVKVPFPILKRRGTVIARVWHGYTKPENADAYESLLKPELLPGLSKVKGYKSSYLLRKDLGGEVEFITIIFWDSIDAIRAIAGADYETAVIPEERRKYLARYDQKAAHYEVPVIHPSIEKSIGPAA
jgi:heme-degrading monooxygenase HmoA